MNTTNFTSKDIVNFAAQKDAVNLAAAFNQMVGQRVVDAIQSRKVEVASSMFASPADVEEVESDELELSAAADESTIDNQIDNTDEQPEQGTEESDEDTQVNN